MNIWGTRETSLGQGGANVLVTLKIPFLCKDGKNYKYIQGRGLMGWPHGAKREGEMILAFSSANSDIAIPLNNICSIQECNKILKNDGILTV